MSIFGVPGLGKGGCTPALIVPYGAGEPCYNPAINTLVFYDNMDGYTTAQAMYDDVSSNPRMQQSDSTPPNPDPADILLSPGGDGQGRALLIAFPGVRLLRDACEGDSQRLPL